MSQEIQANETGKQVFIISLNFNVSLTYTIKSLKNILLINDINANLIFQRAT